MTTAKLHRVLVSSLGALTFSVFMLGAALAPQASALV